VADNDLLPEEPEQLEPMGESVVGEEIE